MRKILLVNDLRIGLCLILDRGKCLFPCYSGSYISRLSCAHHFALHGLSDVGTPLGHIILTQVHILLPVAGLKAGFQVHFTLAIGESIIRHRSLAMLVPLLLEVNSHWL